MEVDTREQRRPLSGVEITWPNGLVLDPQQGRILVRIPPVVKLADLTKRFNAGMRARRGKE
jgi:hypothetical protein